MKYLVIYLVLLAISSCGKDALNSQGAASNQAITSTQKLLTIPDDLKSDIASINQELAVYPKLPPIDNLIIQYGSDTSLAYENEARGICIKGSTPKIILYTPDWIATTAYNYTKGPFQKTASLFHLIGHCVFNKAHNDVTYQYSGGGGVIFNSPKSFMNSDFKESNFSSIQLQGGYTSIISDLKREFYNYYGAW